MTRHRTGYVVALVVAVVVLVGSVAAAVTWAPRREATVERALSRTLEGTGPGRGMMAGPGGHRGAGMGRGTGAGNPAAGLITLDEARDKALTWVDAHLAGAVLDQGVPMSGGYRFTATLHGEDAAIIVVHDDGTLVAHLVSAASPAPSS
ncbi:hypothetical protein [Cellulomonas citrea]|uniref:hypothetical protein n=1 Tax=Cellulomonas citrea TaxID=1909423 RepID=UPI0013577641|nr:hypothetical protein [Cellulomonas citrea]